MHIEHFLESVGGVGVQVGFECAHRLAVQELVLLDEGLELLLDACQLVLSKFVVVQLHFRVH